MSKFEVLVSLKKVGEFDTFVQAFRVFFAKIKETLAQGTSLQVFETANFITLIRGNGQKFPMDFYQARDFAYEIGLLAGDGELQENVKEPPLDVILSAFLEAF
jgi:hypothetical protein